MEESKTFELELKILGERENKETHEKFMAFQCFSVKQNRWIDLRFTRECKQELPTKNCILVLEEGQFNINDKGKFPVCWVSSYKEIKEIDYKSNVDKYF